MGTDTHRLHKPLWTQPKNAPNAAVMPPRSHLDKLVEDEQRSIIDALLKSAAQGDMARSAFLAGRHDGLRRSVELRREAAVATVGAEDADIT